jgi:glycosyl transferase family 25
MLSKTLLETGTGTVLEQGIKCLSDIKHAFYINLDHRTDRKEHVEKELNIIGVNATRFEAIKMENGAIGCSMSHLKILQTALKNGFDHVLVVEDDIKFLSPPKFISSFNKFLEKHGNNWDVILFAGNNMPPYETVDDTCIKVKQCQTTTGYLVNGNYIKTMVENIKMGLSNLIRKPDKPSLYAIDKFWFTLQQSDAWFLIIPPTVVQREDYSDIEKKVINYQAIMVDLDKKAMFKQIEEYKLKQLKIKEQYMQQIEQHNAKVAARSK